MHVRDNWFLILAELKCCTKVEQSIIMDSPVCNTA